MVHHNYYDKSTNTANEVTIGNNEGDIYRLSDNKLCMPPSLICHLCGRLFGTSSLSIHLKQCYKREFNSIKHENQNRETRKSYHGPILPQVPPSCYDLSPPFLNDHSNQSDVSSISFRVFASTIAPKNDGITLNTFRASVDTPLLLPAPPELHILEPKNHSISSDDSRNAYNKWALEIYNSKTNLAKCGCCGLGLLPYRLKAHTEFDSDSNACSTNSANATWMIQPESLSKTAVLCRVNISEKRISKNNPTKCVADTRIESAKNSQRQRNLHILDSSCDNWCFDANLEDEPIKLETLEALRQLHRTLTSSNTRKLPPYCEYYNRQKCNSVIALPHVRRSEASHSKSGDQIKTTGSTWISRYSGLITKSPPPYRMVRYGTVPTRHQSIFPSHHVGKRRKVAHHPHTRMQHVRDNGNMNSAASKQKTQSHTAKAEKGFHSAESRKGADPLHILCYLCGGKFGTHSINIHLKACGKRHEQQIAKAMETRRLRDMRYSSVYKDCVIREALSQYNKKILEYRTQCNVTRTNGLAAAQSSWSSPPSSADASSLIMPMVANDTLTASAVYVGTAGTINVSVGTVVGRQEHEAIRRKVDSKKLNDIHTDFNNSLSSKPNLMRGLEAFSKSRDNGVFIDIPSEMSSDDSCKYSTNKQNNSEYSSESGIRSNGFTHSKNEEQARSDTNYRSVDISKRASLDSNSVDNPFVNNGANLGIRQRAKKKIFSHSLSMLARVEDVSPPCTISSIASANYSTECSMEGSVENKNRDLCVSNTISSETINDNGCCVSKSVSISDLSIADSISEVWATPPVPHCHFDDDGQHQKRTTYCPRNGEVEPFSKTRYKVNIETADDYYQIMRDVDEELKAKGYMAGSRGEIQLGMCSARPL